jgi:hypothetical protein
MRLVSLMAILAGVFAWVGKAPAADSVVFGRAMSNTYIPDVDGACGPLAADDVCMDVWFVWAISVKRTVGGPPVTGRVRAARAQHSQFDRRYMRSNRLFLLRPIDDPEQRALLRADYRLIDMSVDECLEAKPKGLDAAEIHVRHNERGDVYCFAADGKRD